MVVGLTVVLPGVATPPIPLSITAASALLTNPQLSVTDCPAEIVLGETLKDAIFGVPEQPTAGANVGAGAGANVGAGAGARDMALILTQTVTPNRVPSGLRNCQKPCAGPGAAGAVMGMSKSAVAPGGVFGTPIVGTAPIWSPLTNPKV